MADTIETKDKEDKTDTKIKEPSRKRIRLNILKRDRLIFITKFVVIPLVILLIALRIFVVKTYERELFYSSEAYVQRVEVKVGSEGYGNISSVNVNIGDFVHKGDVLYKYINTDLDDKIYNLQKKGNDLLIGNTGALLQDSAEANVTINDFNKNIEFTVHSKIDGIIKNININIGDYVTKDLEAMDMEDAGAFVSSYIKVPVNLIDRISPGTQAFIRINHSQILDGYIKDVSPTYDPTQNLLKVDVLLSTEELAKIDIKNVSSGTPVDVIISSPDSFTEAYKDFVNKISFNFVKRYLTYEIQ